MSSPVFHDFAQFQTAGGAASGTFPRPANLSVGEQIWVSIQTTSPANYTGDIFVMPAGFEVVSPVRGPGISAPELIVATKEAASDEPSSYAFSMSGAGGYASIGCVWRSTETYDVEPYYPGQVSSANSNTSNVSSLSLASVNYNAQDKVVCCATCPKDASVTVSGLGLEYSAAHSNNAGLRLSVLSSDVATSGSTGENIVQATAASRMRAAMFVVRAIPEAPPEPDEGTDFTSIDVEPTTSGYNLPFEVDGNDTVSVVAVIAGSAQPSATQVHEGKNQAGTVLPAAQRNSVSATADTPAQISLTGLDLPLYSVAVAVGDNVEWFPDEYTLPLSGYQYQVVDLGGGSLPSETVLPAGTAGNGSVGSDVLEISATVAPQGVGLTPTAKGGLSLNNQITGRTSFEVRTYDYSAGTWATIAGLSAGERQRWYFNNGIPVEVTPIPAQQWFVGIPIEEIRLDKNYVSDPESDDLTYSVDPTLPAGISIEIINDQDGPRAVITGTPEEESEDDYVITVTDEATDTVALTAVTITVSEGVEIPDVIGDASGDAIDALNTLELSVDNIIYDPDSEEAPGTVVGIFPAVGQIVPPGTQVYLTVAGYAYYALTDPARNNTNSLIPPGTVANWALWMGGDVDSPRKGVLPDHTKEGAVFDADSRMPFGSNSPGAGWLVIDDPHATDKSLSQIWSGPVVIGE